MRRFEFVEGSSSKFWEIDQDGASYTVTYGRIGSAGSSKTTACATKAAADAEVEKLVREKLKKGYQEQGAAQANWRPPKPIPHYEHPSHFMGYSVARFNPEAEEGGEDDDGTKVFNKLTDLDRRVFSIHCSFDDGAGEPFVERLKAMLADPKVGQLKALLFGNWWGEVCEEGPTEAVELLIANAKKLTSLAGLFIGDVVQEENEISWIHNLDYGPLLRALPQLRELVVRGGDGLRLSKLSHAGLQALTLQTGGLAPECVRDVGAADLPELRRLTLWLGTDEYGGGATADDLAELLSGERFPKLEYLGLLNAQNADEVATAVARSKLLSRVKGLDLSMGTLTDEGAKALLASPALQSLATLNLAHHYLSDKVVAAFKALPLEVDLSDAQSAEDEEDRYCAVSE